MGTERDLLLIILVVIIIIYVELSKQRNRADQFYDRLNENLGKIKGYSPQTTKLIKKLQELK
jgi:hypothetical protein